MKLKKSTNQTKNYPTKEQIKPLLLGLGVVFTLTACHTKPNVEPTKKEPTSTTKPPITAEEEYPPPMAGTPVFEPAPPPPVTRPKIEKK